MTAEPLRHTGPTARPTRAPLSDQVRRTLLGHLSRGRWQPGDRIVDAGWRGSWG